MNLEARGVLSARVLFFLLLAAILCASPLQAAPPSVDPKVVGVWELPINGGRWVWTIKPNGTYEFYSEARDGAGPHSGSFSASAGHWSMRATNGYTDAGTYQSNPPGTFLATGRLGTAAWNHPGSTSAKTADVIGKILSGIAAGRR